MKYVVLNHFFLHRFIPIPYLPLHVGHKVGEVGAVQGVDQVHLVAVVCPGAKGESALLHVEGEEGHVHRAGALGYGRLVPHHRAVAPQHNVGLHGAGELIVRTGVRWRGFGLEMERERKRERFIKKKD